MGLLQNKSIYLSGPIECVDDASGWRDKISPLLTEIGLSVWNPLKKPSWMDNVDGHMQREMARDLLYSGVEFEAIKKKNGSIRKFDLHLAANCDVMILNLNGFTVGSFEELYLAQRKPVFVISDKKIPSMWLLDQLDAYNSRDFIFHQNIASLIDIIKKVDSGEVSPTDLYRWVFLSYNS